MQDILTMSRTDDSYIHKYDVHILRPQKAKKKICWNTCLMFQFKIEANCAIRIDEWQDLVGYKTLERCPNDACE